MSLLLPLGTLIGIVLAVLNIREKLRAPRPHPLAATLDARLAEIAAAIRERHAHGTA
jgi:hypothetical protein